jgi:acyl carrier protein
MQPVIDTVTTWLRRAAAPRIRGELTADTELVVQGILDSIEILNLVSFLEEHFGVSVPIDDFIPENFATPRAIADLVGRLRELAAAA